MNARPETGSKTTRRSFLKTSTSTVAMAGGLAGVRSVMATVEEAKKKGLNIVSGLCWRYDTAVKETMKRVLDGAIGEILSIQETYLTGTLWHRARQPDWTEMEYQMRNWLYFTWLSGDHNTEQHVHSLDKGSWAMGDEPPVRAWGTGGREVRTDPKYGDIYDHHAVVYQYANGTRMHAYCRQMANCANDVTDTFVGSEGVCKVLGGYSIEGKNPWRHRGRGGLSTTGITWLSVPCWLSWDVYVRTRARKSPGSRQ